MIRALVPLAIFLLLVALLGYGLTRDPRKVTSPLINKPLPSFELPRLRDPKQTLGLEDLKGQVSMLNVWGSWCISCKHEHPMLLDIAKLNIVPIYGLNYKDNDASAIRWLEQLGDPYVANAVDANGRTGINLGVYGAPETYIIDQNGIVAYKHIGPIGLDTWEQTLLPIIKGLKNQNKG